MKNVFFVLTAIVVFFVTMLAFAMPISAEPESVLTTTFETVKVTEAERDILGGTLPIEVYKVPERPHYLLGVNQIPEASYERLLEIQKLYQMKGNLYKYNGGLYIDKSVEKLGLHKNENYLQLTSEIEVAGRKILVIYPLHLLSDPINKEFIYMSPAGPKNLAQFSPLYRKYEVQWALGRITDKKWTAIRRALGWAQFEAVKEHLFGSVARAIEWNVKSYNGLTEKVYKKHQELLDKETVPELLGESVAGLPGFRVQDILLVPMTKPEDFLPDILIFGPLEWAWGIANWKTIGSERIVFYDILGAAYDYVRDEPLILAHEFVHSNPYLQSTPTTLYFNLEMWTALTTDLADELMYFFHPYLIVPTDTAHTYFGYNVKEAAKRIWPNEFVSLQNFNRSEYQKNIERVQEIRRALKEFTVEVFLPTFYADPYFWNSVNTKWCDTSAVWRIMMAFHFEPSILFDPNKIDEVTGKPIPPSVQTKQWLSEQEAAGKLQKLAEEALRKTGGMTKMGKEMSKIEDFSGLVKCPSDSGYYDMWVQDPEKVEAMVEQLMKEYGSRFVAAMGYLFRLEH